MMHEWASRALKPGERVLAAEPLSLHALWTPAGVAVLSFALGLAVERTIGLLTVLIAAMPIWHLAIVASQARKSVILVTDQRLIRATSFFGFSARSVPLNHIATMRLSRGIIGRLVGVWTLRAQTSAARDARGIGEEDENETHLIVYGLRHAARLRDACLAARNASVVTPGGSA